MANITYYDRKHLALMTVQEKRVNAIFNNFIRAIAPEMRKWKETSSNSVWVRNSAVENAINRRLLDLNGTLLAEIRNNQNLAWDNSNAKNDEIVQEYIKKLSLSTLQRKGMLSRNLDALKTLQNRVDNGLNLSQRLWNITTQTKGHVELFLESGIATGRSAEAIGRDFRQLLRNPNARFRRVRDENGKLQLSQPMKEYNPGRGVYRSSRMNALRVSATETNMAYRTADNERWQQLDFVLGYEVKRSANSVPCAICDALVGRYPKSFNFTTFHPFCRCFAVPVMLEDPEEFADYLLHDTVAADKYVKDIPDDAKKFLELNPKYAANSYFGKNNKLFLDDRRLSAESIRSKIMQARKPADKLAFLSFDPFSPIIINKLSKLKTNRDRQKLLKGILDDADFKPLNINQAKGAKTVMHPLHKGSSANHWEQTKQMAFDLNKAGIDVAFLAEYADKTSADAITMFKKKYVIADFKYTASSNWNTLSKELADGFKQSGTIVLKLDKMGMDGFKATIDYLKRNDIPYGDIIVINRYGKTFEIGRSHIKDNKYLKKLKGKL